MYIRGSKKIVKYLFFISVGLTVFLLLSFSLTQTSTRSKLSHPQAYHDEQSVIIQDIQEQMPNLPITYWNKRKRTKMNYNNTCASFPDLYTIRFNNDNWQTLLTSNGTFHLYNAYLDVRIPQDPSVRILAMVDRIELRVKTYCQFWFEGKNKPLVVPVAEYRYIWVKLWGNFKQGQLQPYLITCKVPPKLAGYPTVVTLVEYPCNTSTVALNILFNKSFKVKDFAVCVKGLDFPYTDLSVRLAEWIELLHVLGVDKIYFYNLGVHQNVQRLLDYYEEKEKIHVTRHSLPGDLPNVPLLRHLYLKSKLAVKRQEELIPYNDCFYKHMYEYKYIVLLDIDEVIMPVNSMSWRELMDKVEYESRLKDKERGSYRVQNVYFLDDLMHNHQWYSEVPRYMHMLQHVYRTANFTRPGFYVKSFFNTKKVLTLHNHNPLSCIGYYCNMYSIKNTMAQLQHYRADCVRDLKKVCENYKNSSVEDKTIWKFKDALVEEVTKSLTDLNLLPGEREHSGSY